MTAGIKRNVQKEMRLQKILSMIFIPSLYGNFAPLIITVLFSLYHFWLPFNNLFRISAFLPAALIAWRKKNIYIAIVFIVCAIFCQLSALLFLLPDFCPISAMKTRIWIAQGRLAESLGWAHERNLSLDDMPNYLHEFEHIILARLFIAQYHIDRRNGLLDEVIHFLDLLAQSAERGGRFGSVLEILILQALAYRIQGKHAPAFMSLEHAMALAEPEGYIKIFTDEGPPMERFLQEALSRGIAPTYTQRLLAAFLPATEQPAMYGQPAQREDLSQREIEVLRHIAQGWTNREIAARLYLSLNTVKVHTRNIYGKLDVNNRMKAVARARETGVLPTLGVAARR